jgi:hypothetical protein
MYTIEMMARDSKRSLAAYRRRKYARRNITLWQPGSIVLRSILVTIGTLFAAHTVYA